MDNEAKDRLDRMEEKVDACLVLLRTLTTADGFHYTLHNKSELWIKAMQGAEIAASRVVDSVAGIHREYEMAARLRVKLPVDTDTRQTEAVSP